MNKVKSDFLANFFKWLHSVVKEADEPIQMVVTIILPFLAPVPSAVLIHDNLQTRFGFGGAESTTAAVAYVMLGFASIIAAVSSNHKYKKDKDNDVAKKERNLYFAAWLIYIASMVIIVMVFELTAETVSWARVLITIALTVGLEVPAGILNASRIAERDEKAVSLELADRETEKELLIMDKKTEASLKRLAIKKGMNVFAQEGVQVGLNLGQTSSVQGSESGQIGRWSGNWKVDRKKMSVEDLEGIASGEASSISEMFGISRSSAYNWIGYAANELSEMRGEN